MKAPMVVLILIVAGAIGFLLVFSQQRGMSPQTTQGLGAAGGGYGTAPSGGGYGTAPAAGGYGAGSKAPSGGHGAPPKAGGYGAPPAGGYGK